MACSFFTSFAWALSIWFFCVSEIIIYGDVHKTLGAGFFDLAFIDHSDQFLECSCFHQADAMSNCGSFIQSNLSLCEEKQFESEVLSGSWLWGGPRCRDIYMYNITNPNDVIAGNNVILQELNPVPLVDGRTLKYVDRDALDEKGLLVFRTSPNWRLDPIRKEGVSAGEIIIPHHVFATLVANGVQLAKTASLNGLHSYYPLMMNTDIFSLFFSKKYPSDYVTSTYVNQPFKIISYDKSLTTTYFASTRLGLQGLSFIRSVWEKEEDHCGYDRDCFAEEARPAGKRISTSATSTCEGRREKAFCRPTTIKYQAHGLQFGVSSLKTLPGSSFFDIEQVLPGDSSLWDYTTVNKVGTTWPSFNEAFFLLHDVALSGNMKWMGVSAIYWTISKYHDRRENCGATAQAGIDSPGIDCSRPGLVNVGSSFDATFPAPLYISGGDAATADVQIQQCPAQTIGCQMAEKNAFEFWTHEHLGMSLVYKNSYGMKVLLQSNSIFPNSDLLIPLHWTREFFALGQHKLVRTIQYGDNLILNKSCRMVGSVLVMFFFVVIPICQGWKAYTQAPVPREIQREQCCG